MFQEKLIITDSSWLPRKYTARTWVPCKYSQQIHLVMPATQGRGKQKKAHGANTQKAQEENNNKCSVLSTNWNWMKPMTGQGELQTEQAGDTEVITQGEVTETSGARRETGTDK